LNFNQNECGSCKSSQKETDELICNTGQKEFQTTNLEEEIQIHAQHNVAPKSAESKRVGNKAQGGNANLLSCMKDTRLQNVNILSNTYFPSADFNADQVEYKNTASNATETKLHDNVSHGKVLGAKHLATEFQDGNSSTNINQEPHAEDHATTSVHAMLMLHAGPKDRREAMMGKNLEKATQGQELDWLVYSCQKKQKEGRISG
jgi:hypothetical protein